MPALVGLLGNIESLVPALAPIAGVGLLARFGWRVSFEVIALLSLVLAVLVVAMRDRMFLRHAPLASRPATLHRHARCLGMAFVVNARQSLVTR